MPPTIVDVRRASHEEWDRLAATDVATYFHSREWAEIWRDYTNGKLRPDAKVLEFSDGVSVLLPLSYQRRLRGVLRQYWLSPGETYGGWLTDAPLTNAHVAELVDVLTRRLGRLFWKLNPYDPTAPLEGSHLTEPDETMVLTLAADFQSVRSRWSKGHRAAARAAERDGVVTRLATTLDDWRGYYAAYEDSLRRWGDRAFTRHAWSLFEILAKLDSPNVRLWLATREDAILGGALCLYAKRHVVYWHGATIAEHFALHPMHAALSAAIRDACERGLTWFDFNPSGPLPGVRAFKKSFGAEPRACPNVRVRRGMWQEAARRGAGISPRTAVR